MTSDSTKSLSSLDFCTISFDEAKQIVHSLPISMWKRNSGEIPNGKSEQYYASPAGIAIRLGISDQDLYDANVRLVHVHRAILHFSHPNLARWSGLNEFSGPEVEEVVGQIRTRYDKYNERCVKRADFMHNSLDYLRVRGVSEDILRKFVGRGR